MKQKLAQSFPTYSCSAHGHSYVLGPCPQCGPPTSSKESTLVFGQETNTTSKASKNDHEKPDFSHLTQVFMEHVARAMMVGEKKYGRYNYTKGHKTSQLIAAILRHATAYNEGEENDPIDGQSHLGAIGANVNMLLRQIELGTVIDDRFKVSKPE